MLSGFFEESIIKRAQKKKLIDIELINLRDFAIDDYGTVDDRPYGGGAGMILRIEPLYKAVQFAISNFKFLISKQASNFQKPCLAGRQAISKTILTSPKGLLFKQNKAVEYSKLDHLIIICGHYEGVDERVLDFVDEEVSIGDFVLTGGEIPAAAIADAVVRLVSGVLKKSEATKTESHNPVSVKYLTDTMKKNGLLDKLKKTPGKKVQLLEYPQYTRPEEYMGKKVPKILLSGDHKKIEAWRINESLKTTKKKRPDLLTFLGKQSNI